MELSWVEISRSALVHNVRAFRELLGAGVLLAPAVKANAYGHGLLECARVFAENGSDYLCVNAPFEAEMLRAGGLKTPLLLIGYTPLSDLKRMAELNVEMVVYNLETLETLAAMGKPARVHFKIETGNHRQGIERRDLPAFVTLLKRAPQVELVGVSTHFANLEDRVNHQYALKQVAEFTRAAQDLEAAGFSPRLRHCANTAAALLLPEAHFNMARTGIGNYGLWPSEKTRRAAKRAGVTMELKPALSWKTVVAQVKDVQKGAFVGYGCTFEMPRFGRIAVLPVGYYDGYVRAHSGKGHVLIRGQRAPVVGRICMNMMMVDVTDIPGVKLEDEVVLLGAQGNRHVSAEDLAQWSRTINYEVTTRINERIARRLIV